MSNIKKRFLEASEAEDSENPSKKQKEEDGLEPGYLEAFQKEAIWREMQLYKKQAEQINDQVLQLKSKNDTYENFYSKLDAYWSEFENALLQILPFTSSEDDPASNQFSFVQSLLQRRTNINDEKLDRMLQDRSQFAAKLLTQIGQNMTTSISSETIQNIYDKILSNIVPLKTELTEKSNKIQFLESQLQDSSNLIEDIRMQLSQAERKILRDKSTLLNQKKESVQSTENEGASPEKTPAVPATPVQTTSQPNLLINEKNADSLQELNRLKEDYEVAKNLADFREKELTKSRQEYMQLRQQFEQALIDLQSLPEHVISNSGIYVKLKKDFEFSKANEEVLKSDKLKLEKEIEGFQKGRKEFQEFIIKESQTQKDSIEEEKKNLSNDLNRIRATRDDFQKKYQVERLKTTQTKEEKDRYEFLLEAKQKKIACLEEDLRRLKLTLASGSGQSQLFFDSLIAYEQSQLKSEEKEDAKTLISSLQERLEKAVESNGQSEVKNLQQKVEHFTKIMEESSDDKKTIEKLLLELESYKQTQEAAIQEIETISEMYTKLETRLTDYTKILNAKDDQIIKALSDKTKVSQDLITMTREKDTHANKVIASKKLLDKQEELLKAMKENLTAKEKLIHELESEIAKLNTLKSVHEQKALEAFKLGEGLSAKIEKTQGKTVDLSQNLKQKDVEIFTLQDKTRSLEELTTKLQTRIKNLSKRLQSAQLLFPDEEAEMDPSEDVQKLQKEIQDLKYWKKVAQCDVCEFRVKDHLLLKCMHVFCKECIDKRLETRQRKCPTCGQMFGPGDVKTIFI